MRDDGRRKGTTITMPRRRADDPPPSAERDASVGMIVAELKSIAERLTSVTDQLAAAVRDADTGEVRAAVHDPDAGRGQT